MKKSHFYRATLAVNKGSKKETFDIIHDVQRANLLQRAADSWLARTKDYTDRSFCDYLKSKGYNAITIEEYHKIIQNDNHE